MFEIPLNMIAKVDYDYTVISIPFIAMLKKLVISKVAPLGKMFGEFM